MSIVVRDGFECQRLLGQEEEEEEEEEEEQDGFRDVGESRLVANVDQWDISSHEEILEDFELLQELKSDQEFLADDDWNFDLGELQGFEGAVRTNLGRPADQHKHLDNDESLEEQSSMSYWHPQRDQQLGVPEDDQDPSSSQDIHKRGAEWDAGSEDGASPELSFEGQYGSEYSASPEALGDPLALYKCSKSYSFTSEGAEDEFSENSNLSPSPLRLPPECSHLEIDAYKHGERQEFSEETELTPLSRRNSQGLNSPSGFILHSHSPLSVEGLQKPPKIEAKAFLESSGAENMDHSLGGVDKMAAAGKVRMPQPFPFTPKKSLLDPGEKTEIPHALRQLGRPQPERTWKLKADVPHGLPSKWSRQSRSLSPRGRKTQKKSGRSHSRECLQVSRATTPVTSDNLQYGQGQLNYPLPDLSKVEPRVRFPKDAHSYHPPRGKTVPLKTKELGKPVIFKSPAEIVREVLLSSGEGSLQKCPTPTISVIPEEFKSPRQATELVHQLQEDYHKLLTKYAEAENTIDRLRLGAKVRLYSDPPKPSQGVQMGTVSQASKVMTITIPQARKADFTGRSSLAPVAARNQGCSGPQTTSVSLPTSRDLGNPRADSATSTETPLSGEHLTRLLAAQARKFQTQVENLEELIQTRRLPLQDQLKGFARLKEAQDALEQAYLQARDEHRRLQNHQEPEGALGDFDPNRAVEGDIFHLEMHLEELKEKIDRTAWDQPIAHSSPEAPVSSPLPHFPGPVSEAQMRSPTPSLQAPTPAIRTPYPKAPALKSSDRRGPVDVEVSSISDDTGEDDEEGRLPEPLQQMKVQVEKDFNHLLDSYSSFKSLPEALSLEELHLNRQKFPHDETDEAAAGEVGTEDGSIWAVSKDNKVPRTSLTLREPGQKESPELSMSRKTRGLSCQISPSPSVQEEEKGEKVPQEATEKIRSSSAAPKSTAPRRQKKYPSLHSSLASMADSAVSEHATKKSPQKTNKVLSEASKRQDQNSRPHSSQDLRLVSPETDSGFVGSEASRVSPVAQGPKFHSSQLRSHGTLGKSASIEAAFPRMSPKKEPVVMEMSRTDTSPRRSTPDVGVERRSLSKGAPFQHSSPPRWTNSLASEMEPGTDSTHTDSDAEVPGGCNAFNTSPDEARYSPSSSAASLSPVRTRRYSLLDSRLERDQAIAALKKEVSHLRRSLEETLHQPHGPPKQSSSPHTSTQRDGAHFSTSANLRGSNGIPNSSHNKTLRKSAAEHGDPELIIMEPEGWTKRPSLPPDGTRLQLSPSESNYSPPRPRKGKHQESSTSRIKSPKQSILRGPYTGTQYPVSSPESQAPKPCKSSGPFPHCQDVKLEDSPTSDPGTREPQGCDSERESFRPSLQSTQKKSKASHPLCNETGNPSSKVAQGVEHSREDTLGQSSRVQQVNSHPQPGLWYWVIPPPTTSITNIPTIPLASYLPPSIIYCSPLAPQSTFSPTSLPAYVTGKPQAAELKSKTSLHQPQENPSCSLTLDRDGLQDLNWSLSRAIEAAKDMKLTTKRISQSLTSDLNQARRLHGSCLF